MIKKKIKYAGIVLILLFALNIFSVIVYNSGIPANNHKKSGKIPEMDELIDKDDDTIDENPIMEDAPKTSSAIELEQDYDFSFNTTIDETFNNTWSYTNLQNNTFFNQDVKGLDVTFQLNITNLRNSTNDLVDPSFFNALVLTFWNFSIPGQNKAEYFPISDAPGTGNCTSSGEVYINETYGGYFKVDTLNKNCTFDALMYFNGTKTRNITTEFIPDTENTDTDLITWDLNYQPAVTNVDNYNAILNIENYSDFTINSVAGKEAGYWKPINYTETATGFKFNETFEEISIELTTPNYISIVYNDNLTFLDPFTGKGEPDDYELRLYVTCKAAGNLTIYFRNSTGDVNRTSQMVVKDDIVFFNYIMNQTTPGGLGSLEISLTNKTDKINFGMKFAEITFHKNALIFGHTDNTSAFTDFFILGAYIDLDKLMMLMVLNSTGQITITEDEMFNQSSIVNATVTYNLEGLAGELDYGFISPEIGFDLYYLVVDLKEFQIAPGEYNLTFNANKIGYANVEFVDNIVISKKNVTLQIDFTPSDKIIEVEENFAISVSFIIQVSYPPYYESFLRLPVKLSWEITRDGELDNKFVIPEVIQAYTSQGQMENDSLPGNYLLNFTIISDYYQGNITINATVVKKPLTVSLIYDEDDFEEDEEFDIQWQLVDGDSKNRENMSIEFYIDGIFKASYDLESGYAGITRLELEDGDFTLTYRLTSPFYTSEKILEIDVEKEEGKEPTWLEENWIWLLIGTLTLIGTAVFATSMLISRHKIKAQRALDSELIALKTKATAIEQRISLINTQISEIASIYWIIIVHSEQGTTIIEINDFRFEEVLGEEHKHLIGKGTLRDSALIGGFLTAIRNFAKETSGTSLENQPVFNSQTDYSTIVDNEEIHRRILEGSSYFMAFVSSRGTMEISDTVTSFNSNFEEKYGEEVKRFVGAISPFKRFIEEGVAYLHYEIRKLQEKQIEEELLLNNYNKHLRSVQDQIGIKPKKSEGIDYL
jgi:hypothetical protein